MSEEKPKSAIAQKEEEILKFWKENRIFEKTLEKKAPKGDVTFYDGPPFATGLPHYGHILAGTIKDVIPRFETMRGKRVLRRWGWDCHGLPIENLIEKELGIKSKIEIEQFGIEKFNNAARASVLRYDQEWKRIVPRSGRFVDMDDKYLTMSPSYMESVWWSFKTLYDKGLIYQGFKAMHLCPHCETTLANFEVGLNYKDITDISLTAKFELVDEPKTYLLAWTTTPWTLPGNVALAVNPDISYVKVKKDNEFYIVAEALLSKVFKEDVPEIIESFKGESLVHKSYKPVFNYYEKNRIGATHYYNTAAKMLGNLENNFKVYGANFVSTEDGTGIVHIAPAFGEDDLVLAQKENLSVIQHVGRDGKFIKDVRDFAGQLVKPKDDHQKADIEIIKYLAHNGLLFAKEKIVHSYPHCWRCQTPLLNYASTSWFVEVTKYKNTFIKENKKVNWVPEDLRDGRFGKWLEGARDWAISRSRYWGSTLPVWVCKECDKKIVIGSVAELKEKTKSRNTYFVMRHGESESNTLGVISANNSTPRPLTEKGKRDVEEKAKKIKGKIDLIVTSPLLRTKESADIVSHITGVEIVVDDRLQEVQTGEFNEKPISEYHNFASLDEKFEKRPQGGENLTDLKKRVGECIYDLDSKYEGKRILIITHEYPVWMLYSVAEGAPKNESIVLKGDKDDFIKTAEIRELSFSCIPHNNTFELDLHRPYIDEVTFSCTCGGVMKRIPEVFDTWYESGSMPYASHHYPFEKKTFDVRARTHFPADFIAEGIDQTRGWFYSLLMLSVGLFGKAPYRNVIVNGTVLAEDGQKMSKSLNNYPPVDSIFDKYGADAMRYYLLSSPVVHGEDFSFSEKGVDEVVKKLILRLQNVCSFYEMYPRDISEKGRSDRNILDVWIISRLSELRNSITKNMEGYVLDSATRPLLDFVDDFSTWYIRRSRERFKGDDDNDKADAKVTTQFVLRELSKLLAPFMPFIAEEIYQKVKDSKAKESVHLEDWPKETRADRGLIDSMKEVRRIASLGLEARTKASLNVRQPLQALTVKSDALKGKEEFLFLIASELNVKEILFDSKQLEEVSLDVRLTPELREEGDKRNLFRFLQDLRKKQNLNPHDKVGLIVDTSKEGQDFIEKVKIEMMKTVGITSISYKETEGESFALHNLSFTFILIK